MKMPFLGRVTFLVMNSRECLNPPISEARFGREFEGWGKSLFLLLCYNRVLLIPIGSPRGKFRPVVPNLEKNLEKDKRIPKWIKGRKTKSTTHGNQATLEGEK